MIISMNEMEKLLENSANNIIENNLDGIYEGECDLIPINTNVIIKPYEVNPYRKIDKTASGLIVGIESDKTYKSNETGEITQNDTVIRVGQVIAAGNKCENVEVGDDVFFTTYSMTPIPFRKEGLIVVSEGLLICRIKRK